MSPLGIMKTWQMMPTTFPAYQPNPALHHPALPGSPMGVGVGDWQGNQGCRKGTLFLVNVKISTSRILFGVSQSSVFSAFFPIFILSMSCPWALPLYVENNFTAWPDSFVLHPSCLFCPFCPLFLFLFLILID